MRTRILFRLLSSLSALLAAAPSERTALSVFDAAAVNAGPIAKVTLPYGLPLGLHGQFVAAGHHSTRRWP